VLDYLGDPDRFFAIGDPLGERSQRGKAPDSPGTGVHGRIADQAEALTDQIPCQRLHSAPQHPHRATMVARRMVGHPQEVRRHDLQGDISEGRSDREGVLARLDRAVMGPHLPPISVQKGGDPPQPRPVAEVVEHLPAFAKCPERMPQVEPEVDGLLLRGWLSGRCLRAAKACSEHPTTSRKAERANALVPAGRPYATALSQTSPRTACWASRSACSVSRSAESRSLASTRPAWRARRRSGTRRP
jgi:hypothetical protein